MKIQPNQSNGSFYLAECIKNFKSLKSLGDRAVSQLDDKQIHFTVDSESNSIAVIMKHLSGNMISRWTDFLTSDGEKPDRNRDEEFIDKEAPIKEILNYWEKGWECMFGSIASLTEDDLLNVIYIRAEPHNVISAINRQLSHYAYHIGQIVFLAKHIKGKDWQTLSIPKGKSEEFNKTKFGK